MNNVGTIILCRLHSTRLPKKALLYINGMQIIQRCVLQCKNITKSKQTIIATSVDAEDNDLMEAAFAAKVDLFRGHRTDIATRLLDCANYYNIDTVVRVTGDSPLVSWELADILIDSHIKENKEYTYCSDAALGTSCEIVQKTALEKLIQNFDSLHSEYLSLFFKKNQDFFDVQDVPCPDELLKNRRVNIDYPEDFVVVSQIIEKLKSSNGITNHDLYEFVNNHASLFLINNGIKKVYDNLPDSLFYRRTR